MKPDNAPSGSVPGRRGSTLRGMVFMLWAALFLALMMAGVRHVSFGMHPFMISFFRLLFGFLLLFPVIAGARFEPLRTTRPGLLALRSLLAAAAIMLVIMGLSLTPVAKAAALQLSAPLFATVLAPFLLGEVIRARRVAALVVGYLGALVVLRPGVVALDVGSLFVLAGAALWGWGIILTKTLTRTESGVTITAYMTLLSLPFALLVALPVWETPSWTQVAWLAGIAGVATLGDLTLAQAFKEAEATAVVPLDFTRLVWASLIGYLAFDEVPDAATWLGGAMILGAVTYITNRERKVQAISTDR